MADDQQNILEIYGLSKNYGTSSGESLRAVAGIDLSVFGGEVFGLLGPNGAGKTTTIGMLTTKIKISGGKAAISGFDVAKESMAVKKTIAVVPQSINLDRSLSARENLIFHAKYFGINTQKACENADRLLKVMGLENRAGDYPSQFSGGMARRLLIARALMHDPKIIFLDEATTGLDPQTKRMIWDIVSELNDKGLTIFLTTHNMEEADRLCDRIAIMDSGKILALDTPANLKKIVQGGNIIEIQTDSDCEQLKNWLDDELDGVHNIECSPSTLRLFLDRPDENMIKIIEIARAHGVGLESIELHGVTLEDVFIHLTGKGLRE